MEKNRIIFDLDCTLLTCNYRLVETTVFEPFFKKETGYLMTVIAQLLDEYEASHSTYEDEKLSNFLTERSGLVFTPEIIKEWKNTMMYEADTMEEGVIETLEELKNEDKSLVVLTNWYGRSQIPRLKNAGIYDYFDEVYTGEYQLKPHPEAYMVSIGDYDIRECLIVGDNIYKDYDAPMTHGIDAILYDKKDVHSNEYVKIKKINELVNHIK